MSTFVDGLMQARAYARTNKNPLLGDDPDDIAEAWNEVRDWADIKSGGELTARELDLVADAALDIWRKGRDQKLIHPDQAAALAEVLTALKELLFRITRAQITLPTLLATVREGESEMREDVKMILKEQCEAMRLILRDVRRGR